MQSYLIVLSVSLAVSLILVATKRWHGRFSFDHTEGVQKFHVTPTPRIGGIAIFAGMLTACFVSKGEQRDLLISLMVASVPAFVFGLAEDLTKRVGVTARLLATMASGAGACMISGVAINRADVPVLDTLLTYWPIAVLFTAFAVGGIANAVNIIDGFNGLSSGTVMIILVALALISSKHGDSILASHCMLLAVSVLGFWLLNFPLGKIFLGDGGAYFTGFALAWLAVLLMARNPSVSPWLVLLASAYPVIEVIYSVWRRMRYKQPTGAPDSLHMHSLIKTQLILPNLHRLSAPLKNAAVSPFMWLYAALPASLAVALSGQAVWVLVAALIGCVAVYHLVYVKIERTKYS